ncbi:MAG: tetratricopeptide repeat protein [Bacteroidales bacterium]|nr:tetratricopeptide repeat protein [Bacteroidales bacterium]
MNRQAIKLLLIALIFNSAISSAQSRREIKDKFFEAESWMLFEEYQDALPLYLELLELYPENYNYRYRIGVCYLNIPGQKEKALPYLQEAVKHIDLKYREGKFRETNAPYDALFYLGAAYRITNQLDRAIETYRSFYNGMDHKTYDSTIVKLQIQACFNARNLMKTPLYLKHENMGEYINDTRSDVNPVVSADEKTMVFTRELAFYEGIFYSKKVDGLWSPPIQIQAELLIDDGYSTSLSPDGNELYIYRDDGYDGNIYVSNYENGRWSPAQKAE